MFNFKGSREAYIYDKCIGFLLRSISPAQYGGLKSRSSLQQLLVFYRGIMDSLTESKSQIDVVYMEFAKAFDSVSHNELLQRFGICGDVCMVVVPGLPK